MVYSFCKTAKWSHKVKTVRYSYARGDMSSTARYKSMPTHTHTDQKHINVHHSGHVQTHHMHKHATRVEPKPFNSPNITAVNFPQTQLTDEIQAN